VTTRYRVLLGAARGPIANDIHLSLKAYLGPLSKAIYRDHSSDAECECVAILRGDPCNPAQPLAQHGGLDPNAGLHHERWFSVQLLDNEVQVTLRQPDEATHALARGYAEFVARYWRGQLETP